MATPLFARYKDISEKKKRKAVNLRRNGMGLVEISNELLISYSHLTTLFKERLSEEERKVVRYKCNTGVNNSNSVPYYLLKNGYVLKRRLIDKGMLKPVCCKCGWDYTREEMWLNLPEEDKRFAIPLQLDHINGDKSDCHLINLRFLCPNHHALSPTYCRPKPKGFQHKYPDRLETKARQGRRCGFTDKVALEIRKDYAEGMTVADLSRKHSSNHSTIGDLVRGNSYKHLL